MRAATAAGLIDFEVNIAYLSTAHGRGLRDRDRHRNRPIPVRNHLKAFRADHAWTQQDLADRVNVSRQTINAIEKEKFDPSLPIAFRIAKVFDLTIEEIFVDDGRADGT